LNPKPVIISAVPIRRTARSKFAPLTPRQVTPLLILDRYALFYIGLTIAATFAVALLSFGYLEIQAVDREEFYVLLLVAALGSSVLVASSHPQGDKRSGQSHQGQPQGEEVATADRNGHHDDHRRSGE